MIASSLSALLANMVLRINSITSWQLMESAESHILMLIIVQYIQKFMRVYRPNL